MHYIYVISNFIDNKIYIGQTINPKSRWSKHRSNVRRNKTNSSPHLYHAIIKYGIDNFKFQTIFTYETLEEANEAEIFFIKTLNTTDEKFGYNISLGGFNTIHSEETKRKMSLAQTGKKMSEESKIKMSLVKKGKSNHSLGKPKSEEQKIKQSIKMKENHMRKRKEKEIK